MVDSKDHSIIALLGESPGATSVSVALEVIERNFEQYLDEWKPKIKNDSFIW